MDAAGAGQEGKEALKCPNGSSYRRPMMPAVCIWLGPAHGKRGEPGAGGLRKGWPARHRISNCPLPAPALRARVFSDLHNDLQEVFDPLRLDLSLLEENHSVFQFEAVKGICIYARDESVRDRYEMDIMRRAADFRPVLEAFLREVPEEV